MTKKVHGKIRPPDGPSGNQGNHPVEGLNPVADEAARAAIVVSLSLGIGDRSVIVHQDGGIQPGWYRWDGAAWMFEGSVATPPVTGPIVHAQYTFGGKLDNIGKLGEYFRAARDADGGMRADLDPRTVQAIIAAITFQFVAWNSETADGTTVIKLLKNGLVVEAVTLTGVSGVKAITSVYAAGDLMAIEADAGTISGRTIFSLG